MRRHGRSPRIEPAQVEALINDPLVMDRAPDGKPRYMGFIGTERVWVVVALDKPDLVVTMFREIR